MILEKLYMSIKVIKNETYNNSRYIEFIPKESRLDSDTGETNSTGYYNSTFKEIEADEDAFKFWEGLSNLLSKHINPIYAASGQNISTLSLPQVEAQLGEEFMKAKISNNAVKTIANATAKYFKEDFYDKGYFTDKEGIRTNYNDRSKKEIYNLKEILNLNSTKRLQELAKKENIPFQSLNDILKDKTEDRDKEEAEKII